MIISFLLTLLIQVIGAAFSWLPVITSLPFGIDLFLIQAVGYVKSFVDVFWPLQPVWNCLLFYLPFKFSILVLKAIFGERVPDAS